MSSHGTRLPPTGIGGLTSKDHYREATLRRKIDEAYRSLSSTSSARLRRRQLRIAHRYERALIAQRRRPQSALNALAFALVVVLAAIIVTRASLTLALIAAILLFVDWRVLRHRRRQLQRA